ncbi:hypothetical protein ACWDY4_32025 [Streptomyces olivaceoviridis]
MGWTIPAPAGMLSRSMASRAERRAVIEQRLHRHDGQTVGQGSKKGTFASGSHSKPTRKRCGAGPVTASVVRSMPHTVVMLTPAVAGIDLLEDLTCLKHELWPLSDRRRSSVGGRIYTFLLCGSELEEF